MKRTLELGRTLTVLAAAAYAVLLAPHAFGEEVTLEASLAGPEVSGDPDGRGQATVTIDTETKEVDVRVTYANIAEPTAMHIREGATGEEGGIVLAFTTESGRRGTFTGRGTTDSHTIEAILAAPERHYLVVFNREHVVGALRGPLRRAGKSGGE